MFELQTNPEYDRIMRHARQLRAQAMREMFQAIFSLFRRKPQAGALHV